jgi:HEPN domain-containing protein
MKRKDQPSRREYYICRNARDFEKAAEVLSRPKIDGKSQYFYAPAVVNSAFCLELYLKCLLIITGVNKRPWGHQLNTQLFRRLNKPDRDRIELMYETDRTQIGASAFPSFKTAIRLANKAFEDWRYIHESRKSRIYVGALVIEHVKKLIAEKRPGLQPVLDR